MKPIKLDATNGRNRVVQLIGKRPKHLPYIWIGEENGATFGCIPERDIKRLRIALNAILQPNSKDKS